MRTVRAQYTKIFLSKQVAEQLQDIMLTRTKEKGSAEQFSMRTVEYKLREKAEFSWIAFLSRRPVTNRSREL